MTARFFQLFLGASVFVGKEFGKESGGEIVFNGSALWRRELNAVVNVAQFQRAADGFDLQHCVQSIQRRKNPLVIGLAAVMFDYGFVLRD
jgi:hypothetical protein